MKLDKILSMLMLPVYLTFSSESFAGRGGQGDSTFTRRVVSQDGLMSQSGKGPSNYKNLKNQQEQENFDRQKKTSSFVRKRVPLREIQSTSKEFDNLSNLNGKRPASPSKDEKALKKPRYLAEKNSDDSDTDLFFCDESQSSGDESLVSSQDFEYLPKPKFLKLDEISSIGLETLPTTPKKRDNGLDPETPHFRGGERFTSKVNHILERAGYEKDSLEYGALKKQLNDWLRFITPFVGSVYPLQYSSETKTDGARLLTSKEMGQLTPVKNPDGKKSKTTHLSETPVKSLFYQFSSYRNLDSETILFNRDDDEVIYDVKFSKGQLLKLASIKDYKGKTNLERMKSGLAPVVVEGAGKPKENGRVSLSDLIILHHILQQGPSSKGWRGGHISLLILPHLIHNHLHGPIHRSGVSLGDDERDYFDAERSAIWQKIAQTAVRLQSEQEQELLERFRDVHKSFMFRDESPISLAPRFVEPKTLPLSLDSSTDVAFIYRS